MIVSNVPYTMVANVPFDAIVALGSNIGEKAGHIADAVRALTADGRVRLEARSHDYMTPPWGVTDQDWFVNAAIGVSTTLPVRDLLAHCQAVEKTLGRERTIRWGPRVIDVDILVYGTAVVEDPDLVLPHPHMTERAFVLQPLMDIAPGLKIRGRTAAEWLAALPPSGIVRL